MENVSSLSTNLIYPRYEVSEFELSSSVVLGTLTKSKYSIQVHTNIRKQKDGIWYLIPVVMKNDFFITRRNKDKERVSVKDEMVRRFIIECYKVLLFYNIDSGIGSADIFGRSPIFIDEDQKSEEERLLQKQVYYGEDVN